MPAHLERPTAGAQQAEHCSVVVQDVAIQRAQVLSSGFGVQPIQEQPAEAHSLEVVLYQQRKLGERCARVPVEAADSHDIAILGWTRRHRDRYTLDTVDGRQLLSFAGTAASPLAQKSPADCFRR